MNRKLYDPCDVCDPSDDCINCVLGAYRALGTVEELTRGAALVKAQDEGRVVALPVTPNTEVWAGRCKGALHRCWYASQAAILDDIERGCIIRYARTEAEAAQREEGQDDPA